MEGFAWGEISVLLGARPQPWLFSVLEARFGSYAFWASPLSGV